MQSLVRSLKSANFSSFYENIDYVFSEIAQALEAGCAILVLRDGKDSFLEMASFGFDSDFHYSFLERGKGNFEKIVSSEEPVLFPSSEFTLNLKTSASAYAMKIVFQEEFLGFILFEFAEGVPELKKIFLQLVSDKIAIFHSAKLNLKTSVPNQIYTNKENSINFELFDFILGGSIGFANSLKANRFVNIQGSAGSGKKSLVKYIYKKLDLHGKLIFLNSLPEMIVKLETSIQEWIALAGNGILVIENVSVLTMGQQRIFFEFIKEPVLEPRIIFLDDLTKHKEDDYQPFWNLLSQHTTQLPNLLSLEKEKLKVVIDILFKHLRQNHHRNDMTLAEDVYDFLYEYPYKESLRDLRNLLEQPIINSKENVIGKEFYLKLNYSKLKSLDFQNEEDLDLRKAVQALERQKILLANRIFSGNQIRMAKALGISRGSLQYKIKQLEL